MCYLQVGNIPFTPHPGCGLLPIMQAYYIHGAFVCREWKVEAALKNIYIGVLNKCRSLKWFLLNKNRKLLPEILLTNQRIIFLYVWQSDIFHLGERRMRHFKCAKNSFINGWTELMASQWIRILRHENVKCLKLIKEII